MAFSKTAGTKVILRAVIGPWESFKQWEAIKPDSLTINNNTNNIASFEMPNSYVEIKAIFISSTDHGVEGNIEYYDEMRQRLDVMGWPTRHINDQDTVLPTQTMDGYVLEGWYLEPEHKNKVDKLTAYTEYPSTIKLYAKLIFSFPELMKKYGKTKFYCEGFIRSSNTRFYCNGDDKYIFKGEYRPTGFHGDSNPEVYSYEVNNSILLEEESSDLVGYYKWVYKDEKATISVYI